METITRVVLDIPDELRKPTPLFRYPVVLQGTGEETAQGPVVTGAQADLAPPTGKA